MSRRRPRSKKGPGGGRPGWLAVSTVVAAAVVAVIAVVVVSALSDGDSEEPRVETTAEGRTKGLASAPVTIVEYSDFQCPFCAAFARTTGRLIDRDYIVTGKVSLEYRHFPFLGDESVRAAEAAECANDQGKFWEYHDMLFSNQSGENRGAFRDDKLKGFATEVGLDRAAFDACLDGHKYRSEVLGQRSEGTQLGVSSTPYFMINGTVILGNQPYEKFQEVIEEELAKGS